MTLSTSELRLSIPILLICLLLGAYQTKLNRSKHRQEQQPVTQPVRQPRVWDDVRLLPSWTGEAVRADGVATF